MTVLRKMRFGYAALVVVVIVLVGLGVTQTIWISSSQSDYDRAADQTRVANQVTMGIGTLASDVGGLSDAVAQGYGYAQAAESFDTDSAALEATIEEAIAATESGSDSEAALGTLKDWFDRYKQAAGVLFEAATSDPLNVQLRMVQVHRVEAQLQEAAGVYHESTLNRQKVRLDQLGGITTLWMILMGALGVLGIVGGIATLSVLPRGIGRTLRGAATRVGSSTSELLVMASQVAASTAQTAASTNEVTTTVEEVKQTATLALEKASQAAEGAKGSGVMLESARMLTEETASGIERMQGEMDTLFGTINTLSERAQAAGDVIAVVNDLAEQSNLLSVNASIEAAKAGEHGKGFSVVAQEVKALAEQSKQAVVQVRTILGEMQKASETAVQAATQSREAVEAGRQKSVEVGEVMATVAGRASDDAQSSLQAAASSRQQLAGMEQLGQAIASINEAGEQSVAGTRQVEEEVKHLQALALELKQLVESKAREGHQPDQGRGPRG